MPPPKPSVVTQSVILVKKAHTNPRRRKIVLRSDSAFNGTGKFECASTDHVDRIHFFNAAIGGTRLVFNNKANVFTAAQLFTGVTLFAEAVKPSLSENDTELRLTLKIKGSAGLMDTKQMTAVEVIVDVAQKRVASGVRPPMLSVDDKLKKGRFIRVQDAGLDNSRAMLVIQRPQPMFKGKLILNRIDLKSVKNQVQIFGSAHEIPKVGQVALVLPHEIEVDITKIPPSGIELWVEGTTVSPIDRGVMLQLGIKDVDNDGDRVMMTVKPNIKITGKIFYNRFWDPNTAPKYNFATVPFPAAKKIPNIKEFLPGAKVEVFVLRPGQTILSSLKSDFLTSGPKVSNPHGAFEIKDVPEVAKIALRIWLDHKGGNVVTAKGLTNAVSESDFEIKTNAVIWHQFELDISKWTDTILEFDFKEIEIKKAHFVEICDAYKSIWFGHSRLKELTTKEYGLCVFSYPETAGTSHELNKQLFILRADLRDRDVLLHEYIHFVEHSAGMWPPHPGYNYNDLPAHSQTSKEHYEAARIEGVPTFVASALQNDPIYHDGYDVDLTMNLGTDNTIVGPHAEGSIQEALWRILKVHGINFSTIWRALSDNSKRATINSVFDFYDNWKDLSLGDVSKVFEAMKKFNMEFGYHYKDGAGMFIAVAAPKTFNLATKEFRTIDELFNNFGTLGGGTLVDYKEEFYNRNKFFNAGKLGAGSTFTAPTVVVGNKYIIPDRIRISP